MNVLVAGAAGQLGQAMVARLRSEYTVTAWTRDTVDLANHRQVRQQLLSVAPAVVINCAGFNNVDQAEQNQETALDINAFVVGTIARASAELDALVIQYSSDFVFAGTSGTPYTESDRPEPQSA